MSPFRLFGRPQATVDDGPDPWLDDPAPSPGTGGPVPSDRDPAGGRAPGGPATAAARPALWTPLWTPHRPPLPEPAVPEPVTDPFGFPPVPARTVAAPAPAPAPAPSVDPAEAAALAGAFAADLLSWDEDDPARRARAVGAHLASPEGAGLLGWDGTGRQRADLVLPGRIRTDGDRARVDVRVRVVPSRRVDTRAPGVPEPEPDAPLGEPAAAPAPAARGWRGLAARWVRIEVTVVRDGDRLVVDAGPVPEPDGCGPAR
ncbi:hypothetical protein [Pseudonocardia sp. EC080625-04]|uniref:hypothetical protein n=1 Tax=Pseudonocardia sp. EC080625-04 TaxID=1096868 RepID=UPI0011AE3666|nr:hypothetical protein [Pseudonocardia sp. EC080625-04]